MTRASPRSTLQATCASVPLAGAFSAYKVALPGALNPPEANPRYTVPPSLLSAGVAWNEEAFGG